MFANGAERESKRFGVLFFAAVAWAILVSALDGLTPLRLPTFYALPVLIIGLIILASRLARLGTSDLPIPVFLAGAFFVAGGMAFDMIATMIKSPDLQLETNPVARTFLDSGHSVAFVYGYSLIAQPLWFGFICVFWFAFLKHRLALVASLPETRSWMDFVKAATGEARLTWRQWLIPLNPREFPRFSQLIWVVPPLLIGSGLDRWYLGLEWFELVPRVRLYVDVIAIGAPLCVYFLWLYGAYQNHRRDNRVDSCAILSSE